MKYEAVCDFDDGIGSSVACNSDDKKAFVDVDRVIVTGSDKFGGCLMAPRGGMNTSQAQLA